MIILHLPSRQLLALIFNIFENLILKLEKLKDMNKLFFISSKKLCICVPPYINVVPFSDFVFQMNEFFQEYGPIFRTWIGPKVMVHVGSAEYAQVSTHIILE